MNIEIGKIVMVKPSKYACQRTKNCIQKHGLKGFEIVQFNPNSWLFGNTPAVRFTSLTHSEVKNNQKRKKWSGWIPLMEVEEMNAKSSKI
tara:strand:+ start:37 stop:306 length:270 start_codon:yes stop_codon:yes gene_type:complete